MVNNLQSHTMSESKLVTQNRVISLQYIMTNDGGVQFHDSASDPIQYVHGCGVLFPKLEQALEGHKVGDIVQVKLFPDEGFGKRDLDLVQEIPIADIPATETIKVGGQLVGADTDGNEINFRITAIRDGMIHLDGNNPLAGQTLLFEIEIQNIRDATQEEMAGKSVLDK